MCSSFNIFFLQGGLEFGFRTHGWGGHWGSKSFSIIIVFNYLPDFSSLTMVKGGSLPRFPSLTMVERMVCCWISSVTMVKDGSLVYGTTNNRMFLDPLWPPNSMLGFGFSSRVHLGVCLLELLFGTNPFVYYHVD